MNIIEEHKENLIRAIKEGEEFQQFNELCQKVKADPELRKQINDFRIHVFQVQNSEEPLDMYDAQAKLCREYDEFRKNTLVNDYLLAELRMCRILQKITTDIVGAIDLDTDEMSDKIGV